MSLHQVNGWRNSFLFRVTQNNNSQDEYYYSVFMFTLFPWPSSTFLKINLFIYYLFLAPLGLRCARAFSSCGEQGLLFIAVRGLLITLVSLVAEHRLGMRTSVVVALGL